MGGDWLAPSSCWGAIRDGFVGRGWDTRSIVEKLELQVGRDLQFIRVNGTVVGGLVGLALYAVSRALGLGGS